MSSQSSFKQTSVGKIPEEWKTTRLGEYVKITTGYAFNSSKFGEEGLPLIRIRDIDKNLTETNYSGEYDEEYLVDSGSILVGMDGEFNAHIWRGPKGLLNQRVCQIESKSPNELDNKFLYYIIKKPLKMVEHQIGQTTVKHLSKKHIESLKIPLPPLLEQEKIGEVLSTVDEAIQKVDEAIEKTERLKKGLMQKLLTEGIDHEEFKETPIGKVPEEWKVFEIGKIADVEGGKRVPKGEKLTDVETPYPYIRVVDFESGGINDKNMKYISSKVREKIKKYTISSDDVYLSIAGTIGLAGLVPEKLDGANLTENAVKLCNLKNVEKEFLAYFLNSEVIQRQIEAYIGIATQPKLAIHRIKKLKVSLPSLSEQRKIAEILSTVDEKLELERERKKRLERIKKGLMGNLLTGKVRVKV